MANKKHKTLVCHSNGSILWVKLSCGGRVVFKVSCARTPKNAESELDFFPGNIVLRYLIDPNKRSMNH